MSRSLLIRLGLALCLASAGVAAAALAWSIRSTPCKQFEKRVLEFYKSVPKDKPHTAEEKKEITEFLDEACNESLKECSFKVCQERTFLSLPGSLGDLSRGKSKDAGRRSKDETSQSTESISPPTTNPPDVNPLAWLDNDLECGDFLREIKDRYPSANNFKDLPADKKRELEVVLRVACSKRFEKCNFKSCKPKKAPTSRQSSSRNSATGR